ncbi:MFS transporter [Polymorphobacter arshaanensis]|uniref:MFS transporter n=1 Tax=Glacieibacterium arshaanense TaxID=2511025 RepID=A0A4Y9EJS8_9SPHN|nr:MFS transporter [Polymorphobacter arshaanensis]TFU00425.1 MFS transporter [Polymorphobacter arshaanensis]
MRHLLLSRRFGPLFATQFLGAFNDNLFKTAMLFLIVFHIMAGDEVASATLVTAATGLFVLPFVLFSGLAGDIADKRDKATVARFVKLAEIAFMGLGAVGLWLGSLPLLFFVLALMGVHSTIFGPVKYAILPQHLAEDELLDGTGLVEGGTFVAILLGQIAGGLLGLTAGPVAIGVALLGALTAQFIPPAPPEYPGARIDWNLWRSSLRAVVANFSTPTLRTATIAISWFWALGAIWTGQFVPLVRNILGGTETVATLFLAAFSIGIAVGSVAVGRLLAGRISARLTPWAAVGMAVGAVDFWFAVHGLPGPAGGVADFLRTPAAWRILADLFVIAVAGGIFSVPLYGVLQTGTAPDHRASAIAANNIINSAFQVGGVLVIGAAIARGVEIPVALVGAALSGLLLIPMLRGIRS